MRQVTGVALAMLGVLIAVVAETGDPVNTADLARREVCQRAIGHGVFPISEKDERFTGCMAAAAQRDAPRIIVRGGTSSIAATH